MGKSQSEAKTPSRLLVSEALSRVARAHNDEVLEAARVDVQLLPTGEATYRIYPADGGPYEGGYLAPR